MSSRRSAGLAIAGLLRTRDPLSSDATLVATGAWHDGEPLPRPRLTAPGFQTLEVSLAADDLERGVRAIRLERVPSQPKKKPVATKPTEEMPTW